MVLFLGGLIVASRNDFELIIDKTCDVRRRNFREHGATLSIHSLLVC